MTPLRFELHEPSVTRQDNACVLLSSGLGGTSGFWKAQLPMLLNSGYRVLTYDQRGTGKNSEALPHQYSIDEMATDVAQIIEASGVPQVHFVGHALGGIVGLQLALQHSNLVTSLSLINGWAKPNAHTAQCFESRLQLLAQGGPIAYIKAQPLFLYTAAYNASHWESVQQEVAHGIEHFQGEHNLRTRINALLKFDVSRHLSHLSIPTWVSAAKDDALIPWTSSLWLASQLPKCSSHYMAYGGHAHNVTQAQDFNQAFGLFLKSATQALVA